MFDILKVQEQKAAAVKVAEELLANSFTKGSPEEAKFDTTMDEIANFDSQIDRFKKVEAANASLNKVETPINGVGDAPVHDELGRYSLKKAILEVYEGKQLTGVEREAHDEISRLSKKTAKGFFMPYDLTFAKKHYFTGVNDPTTGAGLVATTTDYSNFIEALRSRSLLGTLGIRYISGVYGKLAFPRLDTASTFGWVDPDGATNVTATNSAFGTVSSQPRTAHIYTVLSHSLVTQTDASAEAFIRDDVMQSGAKGIDRAGLVSSGASNSPTGVLYASGVDTSVSFGTNGGAPTFAKLTQMNTAVEAANGDVLGNPAYVTTPAGRGVLQTTARSGTVASGYIWDNGQICGFPAYSSSSIPSTLSKGSSSGSNANLSAVMFGWWQNLIQVNYGLGADMLVDPYSFRQKSGIALSLLMDCDFVVRHGQSFAIATDLATS